MLSGLSFFPYLTEEQKSLLASSARTASFQRGELIHSHGDDCLGLFTVLTGKISVSVLSDEGKEVSLFLLKKGDTCILSAACIMRTFDAEAHFLAETDASLSILPASALQRLMHENLRVECEIYKMANITFGRVMHAMQKLLFTSVSSRIADLLLSESRDSGTSSVKATHEQLAKYVGTAREVVTNTLRRFTRDGLVSLHYGTVTILDRPRLEAEALKK